MRAHSALRAGSKIASRLSALAGALLLIAAVVACAHAEETPTGGRDGAPLAPTLAAVATLEPAADLSTAVPLMASPESMVQTVPDAEAEEARTKYQRLLRAQWDTDFTRTTISFDEIMTGGPPKDGIPSIDDPQFESIRDADFWLHDLEPVQVVDLNGDVRAYPVQVMVWHELVNDTVGGEPVVITF